MEFSILAAYGTVIGPEIGPKNFPVPYWVGPTICRTDPAYSLREKDDSILICRSAEKNGILAEKIQKSADLFGIGLYKVKVCSA